MIRQVGGSMRGGDPVARHRGQLNGLRAATKAEVGFVLSATETATPSHANTHDHAVQSARPRVADLNS